MAETKTTKSTKATKASEKPVNIESLREQLNAKIKDLDEAKRSHKSGELVNPRVLGSTRKEIARLHTAIRANELKEKK